MIWSPITRWLIGTLPPADRRRLQSELLGFLEESEAEGYAVSASDAASIAALAIRLHLRAAWRWAPTVAAGVPVAALCLTAIIAVYLQHFEPWRIVDLSDSTSPLGAFVVGSAPFLLVPIAVVALTAGFRVVQHVRRGSYLLPVGLVLGATGLVTQSRLFIERTGWIGRDIGGRHLQTVSPYSVALLGTAIVLPLAFLLADMATGEQRSRRPLTPLPRAQLAPIGLATMALSATTVPIIFPAGLLLVMVSDRWSKARRLTIAAAVLIPLALLLLLED